jgi:hypothetical protein
MDQIESQKSWENMDFEAKQNLLGFFSLLLKIDKRLNPKNYEDNGDTNNPD